MVLVWLGVALHSAQMPTVQYDVYQYSCFRRFHAMVKPLSILEDSSEARSVEQIMLWDIA